MTHLCFERVNVININRLPKLPPRHHSTRGFEAGFELRLCDVPVVAVERVDVADAVFGFFDFAVGFGVAFCAMFIAFGRCESGGCEEEE